MIEFSKVRPLFPLSSERLNYALFDVNHIDDEYLGWLADPGITKYSNQRFVNNTYENCVKYVNSFSASEALFIALMDKAKNKKVGTMTVYFKTHHSTADIGIMIGDKSLWGKGYGLEAWNCILNFLLDDVKVRKVTGGAVSKNLGMITIMEKANMKPDGVRVAQEVLDDIVCDIVHYASFMEA